MTNIENERQYQITTRPCNSYIVHHSQRYNDSVHFHYCIISRDNFHRHILPLIPAPN